jgi:hypothetical protein
MYIHNTRYDIYKYIYTEVLIISLKFDTYELYLLVIVYR